MSKYRSWREKMKFPADDIADEAGVSRATVYNFFRGAAKISAPKIERAIERLEKNANQDDEHDENHGCGQEPELESSVQN